MLILVAAGIACTGPTVHETDTGEGSDPDTDTVMHWSGCEAHPEPSLQVGKGEEWFEPSEDDDGRSVLIHGIQGGYHTFVSVRADGLALHGDWDLRIEGRLDGEVLAMAVTDRIPECNHDADRGESIGTWLIWDGEPRTLHDQIVTIRVLAVDAEGTQARGEAEQRIWDPKLAEE